MEHQRMVGGAKNVSANDEKALRSKDPMEIETFEQLRPKCIYVEEGKQILIISSSYSTGIYLRVFPTVVLYFLHILIGNPKFGIEGLYSEDI